jgi:hypothetical protein
LFLVDELLSDLDAKLTIGLVIALNEFDLLAEYATGFVDLADPKARS